MNKYSPYSEMKIFHHVEHIKAMKEGKVAPPIYLRIKPTNVCNQKCYFCIYANDNVFEDRIVNRDSISWDVLKNVLDDFKKLGGKAVTYSGGGEPLCYHSIEKALKYTNELGLDCSVITNGQALMGKVAEELKNAKWIRVSFDAATSDVYKEIRNVNTYNQVIENIKNFVKIKDKDCVVGVNCVISKTNAEQIYDICKLVKDMGCDNIKLSPVLVAKETERYHNSIKEVVEPQIVRAKKELETSEFHIVDKYSNDYALSEDYKKIYHRCYIQEYFGVIGADSKVYRCHQRAYTEAGELGDLLQESFENIWCSNETINKKRQFDPCEECNFRCAFDERNILLNDFLTMNLEHVNFV